MAMRVSVAKCQVLWPGQVALVHNIVQIAPTKEALGGGAVLIAGEADVGDFGVGKEHDVGELAVGLRLYQSTLLGAGSN